MRFLRKVKTNQTTSRWDVLRSWNDSIQLKPSVDTQVRLPLIWCQVFQLRTEQLPHFSVRHCAVDPNLAGISQTMSPRAYRCQFAVSWWVFHCVGSQKSHVQVLWFDFGLGPTFPSSPLLRRCRSNIFTAFFPTRAISGNHARITGTRVHASVYCSISRPNFVSLVIDPGRPNQECHMAAKRNNPEVFRWFMFMSLTWRCNPLRGLEKTIWCSRKNGG